MTRRWLAAAVAAGLAGSSQAADAPAVSTPLNAQLSGDLTPTHDPVIAREGGTYYIFGTGSERAAGGYISARTSPDLVHWTAQPALIPDLPAWATAAVPGTTGMWAPDISYFGGRWHLYYAVSTFGSNRSAVGLFTSPTLDRSRSDYAWRDEGLVVASTEASDFNAIDPNHVIAADGRHWLALGSFWSGIKLFALDPASGKLLRAGEQPYALARRPAPSGGPAPVEAPFIVSHGGSYFLFVSYDYCCKGANSTYYTVVGRASAITGPYLGRDGSRLANGEGTIFLRADLQEKQRFRGPGHVGFLHDGDGRDLVVYHAYDKANHGVPTLRLAVVDWDAAGWPVAAE